MKHQKLITTAIIWALSFVPLVSITDTPTLFGGASYGTAHANELEAMPGWCLAPPESDLYVIVCGIGESRKLNLARSKATLDAKRQLAESVQSLVSSRVEEIQRETLTETNETFTDAFEATSLSVVENVNISGYEVLDQAAERSGNKYSFYILVQFPRENVETKLIETIKSDTVLSSNELVKDALTELEAEISSRLAN